LKQNEGVLSSQALINCGEESGSQFKHAESSLKMFGKRAVSEILHVGLELDNAVDKFAVNIVKNNKTLGH